MKRLGRMMMMMMMIVMVCLSGLVSEGEGHDHTHGGSNAEFTEALTCGSTIKLINPATEKRLHSHQVNYNSGSRQQSVTGFPGADDSNSFWVVKEAHGAAAPCVQGTIIKSGDSVRLQHLQTNRYLHSHRHPAPLTSQFQEVSCFGADDGSISDAGDNWIIEVTGALSGQVVLVTDKIRLRHVVTDSYLATHETTFGNPIPGQSEVFTKSGKGRESLWRLAEGFYYPPNPVQSS